VLFSGTLRSNLDPWDQHDDAALWRVLSAVQLKSPIRSAGGLSVRMAEAGENLSVGQRQLFCLARWAWEVMGLLFVLFVCLMRERVDL
jgi:ABC-type multidrug transport system fused ATPase/permease subunit